MKELLQNVKKKRLKLTRLESDKKNIGKNAVLTFMIYVKTYQIVVQLQY